MLLLAACYLNIYPLTGPVPVPTSFFWTSRVILLFSFCLFLISSSPVFRQSFFTLPWFLHVNLLPLLLPSFRPIGPPHLEMNFSPRWLDRRALVVMLLPMLLLLLLLLPVLMDGGGGDVAAAAADAAGSAQVLLLVVVVVPMLPPCCCPCCCCCWCCCPFS